jgi:hypothetical protein
MANIVKIKTESGTLTEKEGIKKKEKEAIKKTESGHSQRRKEFTKTISPSRTLAGSR